MAVIQDRYAGAERNVGAPAVVDLLHGWFGTRYAINQRAAAQDGGRDADKLAEMELEAREGLGKLQRALTEARSGDVRSFNDLVGTVVETKGEMAVAGAKANADVVKQKLWFRAKWMEKADAEASKVAAGSAYSDVGRAVVDGYGTTATNLSGPPEARGKEIAARARSVMQSERAGGFGDIKYDAIVRDSYNSLIRAGQVEAADAFAKEMQPNAGMIPTEFYARNHTPMSPQDADKFAKDITREFNGGLGTGQVDGWLRGMGIEPETLGVEADGGESSIEEEATGGAGAGGVPATGGRVRAKGLSAGAAATLTAARDRGEDPYGAILAAIQQQAAFADQLATERKAASEKRRSIYPAANPFLATPNTYVSEEARSAARRVGQTDPEINKVWAGELVANGGNVRRAYESIREDGGVQPRFTAKEYRADMFEEGGDLGGHVATLLNEPAKLDALLGSQPAEVQALFADAASMAANGDAKRAATLAREVSADDVRAAYGQAMQRAEDRPEEIGALRVSLDMLPDDVKAGWSSPFYDVLDEYARDQHTGGSLAAGATRGSIGSLGRALVESRGTAQRRKALDHVAGAENKADVRERGFYDQGRDLALKGLENTADDWGRMEVRRGWETAHRNAPSPLTRGAIDALDLADRRGTAALAQERTGRMQMETTVAPTDIVGKTPAHADISRTPTTIVEEREAPVDDFEALMDATPPKPPADDFDTFLDTAPPAGGTR